MLRLDPADRPTAQQIFDETLSRSGNGERPGYNLKFQFDQDRIREQFDSIINGNEIRHEEANETPIQGSTSVMVQTPYTPQPSDSPPTCQEYLST